MNRTFKRLAASAVGAFAALSVTSSAMADTQYEIGHWESGALADNLVRNSLYTMTTENPNYTTFSDGKATCTSSSSGTATQGVKITWDSPDSNSSVYQGTKLTVFVKYSGYSSSSLGNNSLVSVRWGSAESEYVAFASGGGGNLRLSDGVTSSSYNAQAGTGAGSQSVASAGIIMMALDAERGTKISIAAKDGDAYGDFAQSYYNSAKKVSGKFYGIEIGGTIGSLSHFHRPNITIEEVHVYGCSADEALAHYYGALAYSGNITSASATFSGTDQTGITDASDTWVNGSYNLITLTNSQSEDATLTLSGELTATKLSLAGSGNTAVAMADGATLSIPTYDFSAATGKTMMGFSWGDSELIAGSDTVVDTANLGSGAVTVGSGKKITYSGTTTLSSLPLASAGCDGTVVVAAPYTSESRELIFGTHTAGYRFDHGSNTISVKGFAFGNEGGSSQDIYFDSGTTVVTGTTSPSGVNNDNGVDFLIGHWGSLTVNMYNLGGTLKMEGGYPQLGWNGTANWYIGDGNSTDDATATVKMMGIKAGGGRSNTATLTLRQGGTLDLGTYGIQFASANDTLTFAGATVSAYANTSIANSGTTTSTTGTTTTFAPAAECTLTINSAIAGTGSLEVAGAGTVVLSAAPTTTGSISIASGSTLSLGSGVTLTQSLSWASGAKLVIDSATYGEICTTSATSLDGLTVYVGANVANDLAIANGRVLRLPEGVTVDGSTITVGSSATLDYVSAFDSFSIVVADGGTLSFVEATENDGVITLTNVTWSGTPKVAVTSLGGDAAVGVSVVVDGSTSTVKFTPQVDGEAAILAYEFNDSNETLMINGFASTGSDTTKLVFYYPGNTAAITYVEDDQGNPYAINPCQNGQTPYNSFAYPSGTWTCSIAGILPNADNTALICFGTQEDGLIGLISGDASKNEVLLVRTTGNSQYIVLARMMVPNATSTEHNYVFIRKTNEVIVYLDGTYWTTYTSESEITFAASGMQLGAVYNGVGSTGIVAVGADSTAVIDSMRIYNRELGPNAIAALAAEFQYTSPNGTYSREFAAGSASWKDGTTWASTVEAEAAGVAAPAYNGVAAVTATGDAAISVNLEDTDTAPQYEKISFAGTGPVTLSVADGCSNKLSAAQTVVGCALVNKYSAAAGGFALDMTRGPLNCAGSVTFDMSDYPFDTVMSVTTNYVTGLVSSGRDDTKFSVTAEGKPAYITTVEIAYLEANKAYAVVITPNVHTVTFVDSKNSDQAVVVHDGTAVTAPEAPTAEGFTFGGWCTDAEGTTAYVFTTPVNADLTLYAKWTENPSGYDSGDGTTTFTIDSTKEETLNGVLATSGKTLASTVSETSTLTYAQAYALGLWDENATEVKSLDATITVANGKVTVSLANQPAEGYTITTKVYVKDSLTADWPAEPSSGTTFDAGTAGFYKVEVVISNAQ